MTVSDKLSSLGLVLPQPFKSPPGLVLPFVSVRVSGRRATVSGHLPLLDDGSLAEPLGKVGREVTLDQGVAAARRVGLVMLASLQRELGDLERVTSWIRLFGMVNAAPGFTQTSAVINGCSELLVELFGRPRGLHSRSAVGVAELPFGVPVEIEGEVEID
jgi:enamine deaminase RidA (YjgF/YER057c/UK114 family)